MALRRWVAGAVAAGCLVVGAGCASGGGSDDSASSGPSDRSVTGESYDSGSGSDPAATELDLSSPVVPTTVASMAADQSTAAAGTEGAAGTETASAAETVDVPPVDIGRSVVSTAMVTVESDNVIEARQRTAAIVTSAGGAIFDEETEIGEKSRTTLTLRVPPDQFQLVLSQLGQVGKLTNQGISTEDVTAQVVDLDARIASAEASVVRFREFLAQETSRSEIANLERELVTRETNLETLRGQKRTLDARVDLATIVLTVQPPPVVVEPVPEPPVEATTPPTFVDGLQSGWDTLVSVMTVVGAMAGWVLPFVPFAIAAVVGFRLYRRRHPAPVRGANPGMQFPPPPQPAA